MSQPLFIVTAQTTRPYSTHIDNFTLPDCELPANTFWKGFSSVIHLHGISATEKGDSPRGYLNARALFVSAPLIFKGAALEWGYLMGEAIYQVLLVGREVFMCVPILFSWRLLRRRCNLVRVGCLITYLYFFTTEHTLGCFAGPLVEAA